MFYVGRTSIPKRDVVITEGPLDHLDHAPTLQFIGGKIGDRRDGQVARRGDSSVARRDRDERRGAAARRPALGGVRAVNRSLSAIRRNPAEFATLVTTLTARRRNRLNPD
jgi:hypothetical protein